MWLTPSPTARRSTACAPSRSRGGPNTPGPASCIAPKPMRLIGLSPSDVVALIGRSLCDLAEIEQLEAERLDLTQHAEQGRPVLEPAGQHRLVALQVRHHRGKGGEGGDAQTSPDA